MAVDPAMRDWLRAIDPDVIVVSPVVIVGRSGARQTEITKAGRALGVPVVVGVASWDHLTSKGLIHVVPDAVTVWNETQAREAELLHRIPRSRIIVTGAQSLDHWFAPAAPDAAREFRRSLGIHESVSLLLFTGSSRKMAPNDSEEQFVRRWLAALRESTSPAVREAFVLVRPHPGTRPEALSETLRREIQKLDPNLPLYFVATPKENLDGFVAQNRIIATMFSIFGAIAMVLAGVGIYGVMSFSVNRRTQEFGVRMALGAQHRQILGMVVRQASWQVALGLVAGLGLALALATAGGAAVSTTLFGVTARDPLVYVAVFVLVTVVSLFAVVVPGRRATRVDPLVALRAE